MERTALRSAIEEQLNCKAAGVKGCVCACISACCTRPLTSAPFATAGADVHQRDNGGCNPSYWAREVGNDEYLTVRDGTGHPCSCWRHTGNIDTAWV